MNVTRECLSDCDQWEMSQRLYPELTDVAVSKSTWCFTSIETIRLIRDGVKGGGGTVRRWGER